MSSRKENNLNFKRRPMKIASVVGVSLVLLATLSLSGVALSAKYAIPTENIVTTDMMQECAVNLRRIHSATRRFEKDTNRLPNRLADLVPEYIGRETLLCPHDPPRTEAERTSKNVSCSYIYNFTSARVSNGWPIIGGMRFSDWKIQQMRLFGNVVPMVRCSKHGSKYLNVSVSGQTYVSPHVWERMFVPGYTHGDEFCDVAPSKLRSLRERSAAKGGNVNRLHPEIASSKSQQDSLEIVSTTPQAPTVLPLGERFRVKVRYHLASANQARIWVRPYTKDKRTSSYRAHPSPLYNAGNGEMEGWFYFDRHTKVDEVRVKMVSADSKEPIATASLVVDAEWKPVEHPIIGQSVVNVSPSGYVSYEDVIEAARQGDTAKLKSILAKDQTMANATCFNSYSALYYAAFGGHKKAVELLIDNGADIEAKSKIGFTALHAAAGMGSREVVEFLLSKGSDINAKSNLGRTCLYLPVEKGIEEIVEVLIANGAEVNAQDDQGWSPLHLAVFKNQKDMSKLLISNGANVEAINKNGYTPLHTAAKNGRTEIASFLIAKCADVNAKAKDGTTALHWAAKAGHEDMVNLLIDRGANVSTKDSNGSTPLQWAVKSQYGT